MPAAPTRLHHGSRVHLAPAAPTRLHQGSCRDLAAPSPARCLCHGRMHTLTPTTSHALLLAPAPTLLGRLRMPFLVATPRRHATTPATRSGHGRRNATTPTGPLCFDLHSTPTSTMRTLARMRRFAPMPALRCRNLDFSTPAFCFDGSCHGTSCARTFSCNYGTDAFRTERNGPNDRFPFRTELTDADVLIGDVHLPVFVAVRFRPRFGFAGGPPCAAAEEKRLHLSRWLLRLPLSRRGDRRRARGSHEGPRKDRSTDARCVSSRFTEVGQSIVIKPCGHGAHSRVSMRVWQVKKTKSGLAFLSGYVAARFSDVRSTA